MRKLSPMIGIGDAVDFRRGEAARYWGGGSAVDTGHPHSRGNYRMLETPPDEPIVEIQRVDHESRVHIHIETDHIPCRSGTPGEVGCHGGEPVAALGGDGAPTGQRFASCGCNVPVSRRMLTAGTKYDLLQL